MRDGGQWSGRLDGNANQFSGRFKIQVSDQDGNAESESSFRTPIGTDPDGNENLFSEKFVILSGSPEIRDKLKPSITPVM
jgi:hypothetical protein